MVIGDGATEDEAWEDAQNQWECGCGSAEGGYNGGSWLLERGKLEQETYDDDTQEVSMKGGMVTLHRK